MEKSCRKWAPKPSPRPLFYFGCHCMQEILLKIRYFERALSKTFKKVFFFRTQFPLMDKVMKNKRELELMTSLSSGQETSSQIFLY